MVPTGRAPPTVSPKMAPGLGFVGPDGSDGRAGLLREARAIDIPHRARSSTGPEAQRRDGFRPRLFESRRDYLRFEAIARIQGTEGESAEQTDGPGKGAPVSRVPEKTARQPVPITSLRAVA